MGHPASAARVSSGNGFGGFMGLEPFAGERPLPYPDALLLSCGRAGMAWILDRERPRCVRLPFYTCDCLLHPMQERDVEMIFYRVSDDLLPAEDVTPGQDELTLLIDYFGVRTQAVRDLAIGMGPRAVIDSTHAYFSGAPPAGHYAFNSVRKFRGVPDGGFVFAPEPISSMDVPAGAMHADHLVLRALGSGPEVVAANQANEARLSTAMLGASVITRKLLAHLDHQQAQAQRDLNFKAAHTVLGDANLLRLEDPGMTGPLCYPLLLPEAIDLRRLHADGIFAARYWPDVLVRSDAERFPEDVSRTQRLIAFPIDQRYTTETVTDRAWQLKKML